MALDKLETTCFLTVFLKPKEQYFCSLLANIVAVCSLDKSYSSLPHADSRLQEVRRFFSMIEMNVFTSYFPSSTETNRKNKHFLSSPGRIVKHSRNFSRLLGARSQQKTWLCETQRNENILLECCTRSAAELTETTRDSFLYFLLCTSHFCARLQS